MAKMRLKSLLKLKPHLQLQNGDVGGKSDVTGLVTLFASGCCHLLRTAFACSVGSLQLFAACW